MKKILLGLCLSMGIYTAEAQNVINRPINPFTTLKTDGVVKIVISTYDSLYCKVTGDEDDLNNIAIERQGDVLKISSQGNLKGGVHVTLGAKGLKMITADGVTNISSDVIYKTDTLKIKSDGTANIKLMADAKVISAETDGASHIRLKGSCDTLSINADGASNVKALNMNAKKAHVVTDGTSNVVVNASEELKAYADGVSRIQYEGNPKEKKTTTTGLSKINQYNADAKKNDDDRRHYSWGWNLEGGFKHWAGLGINFNGYTKTDYNTLMPTAESYMELNNGKSIGVDLNILQHNFHIYKNYVNLCTGLGFQFNTWALRNKVTLDPDSSFVTATYNNDFSYKKNVLKASYVNIPLILEFNTSKRANKSFHVGFGVTGGYKLGSRTKQEFEYDGYDHEVRRKDDYNLNPFKVQAIAQIGYSWLNLYGTYSLTPMFENGKGPELYPFTLGIRIVPFDWDSKW